MKKFNDRKSSGGYRSDDRKSPRDGSGSWGRGGDRDSRDSRDSRDDRPQMHSAVCSDCDKRCEVPFKPNGRKPVLCSDCFEGGDGARSSFSKPRDRAPKSDGNFEIVKQLKGLNEKMDKLIRLLTEFDEIEEAFCFIWNENV